MVQRTGKAAKLPFPVHPHMLRHSTGYKLAKQARILGRSLITLDIEIYKRRPDTLRLRLIDFVASGRTSSL
jgi:integrase